jgi:hypothetical protein
MNWKYKNITIEITVDGKFQFNCYGSLEKCASLDEAKLEIDELTARYYKVDFGFVDALLEKLNDREKDFVKQLFYETYASYESGGYYGGLTSNFLFDINLRQVGEDLGIITD